MREIEQEQIIEREIGTQWTGEMARFWAQWRPDDSDVRVKGDNLSLKVCRRAKEVKLVPSVRRLNEILLRERWDSVMRIRLASLTHSQRLL